MKQALVVTLAALVAGCSLPPLPPRIDFASRCLRLPADQVDDCITLAREWDEARDESDSRYQARVAATVSAAPEPPMPTYAPTTIEPLPAGPSMPTPIEPAHFDPPVVHRDTPQSCVGVIPVQFYTATPCP